MANHTVVVELSDDEAAMLQRRVRAKSSPARFMERARIVLLAIRGPCSRRDRMAGGVLAADGRAVETALLQPEASTP